VLSVACRVSALALWRDVAVAFWLGAAVLPWLLGWLAGVQPWGPVDQVPATAGLAGVVVSILRALRDWLVAAPGGSSVGLGDESGKPQISLATSPTLAPSLLLADRDGNAVWKAP